MEWLIWAHKVHELIPTQESDWNQVKVLESRLVQEVGLNQEVETQVHIYFPTTECDFLRLVIQVQEWQASSSIVIGMGIKTDSKNIAHIG